MGIYQLIDDNRIFQHSILEDLKNAKHRICFEMFKMQDDVIGNNITKILLQKLQEGVKVQLLLDSLGCLKFYPLNEVLVNAGAELRIFRPLKFFVLGLLIKNSARNHRKLIIIDKKVTYFGSSNLTDYSLDWRELNVRVEDENFAKKMEKVFLQTFLAPKIYDLEVFKRIPNTKYNNFTIIQDAPSVRFQNIKAHWIELIKQAKKTIVMESPYFLPTKSFRRALYIAASRGVEITIFIPQHSDVITVDFIRNKYLGRIYRKKIDIQLFTPNNLHAKALMIDDKIFSISSANIDYRSFRYQHELAVTGVERDISNAMSEHFGKIYAESEDFDYEKWQRRGLIVRFFEALLTPFRFFC